MCSEYDPARKFYVEGIRIDWAGRDFAGRQMRQMRDFLIECVI